MPNTTLSSQWCRCGASFCTRLVELVALTDRHLLHALLGDGGADVDVRTGGRRETELEPAVPDVVDHVGRHEHLVRLRVLMSAPTTSANTST